MKIAGIYPCDVKLDPKIQHAVSEPYGLEMILAVAKAEGHDVELFLPLEERNGKFVGISEEEMVEKISNYNPDVSAYSMFTCQYPMGKRIAGELKKRNSEIINVAGNRYATYLALKGRVDDCFDFVVLNEGELAFKELLGEIKEGGKFKSVKGLVSNIEGEIVQGGYRERNNNLDDLPDALRFDLILNQYYKGISIPPVSEKPGYAVIESARGCFYQCTFCDVPGNYGNKVIFRDIKRVADEMESLQQRGADIFYFMDLNFTASQDHVMKLCKELKDRKLNAHWYCMSNVASVDGKWEMLDTMKEAGCYKIAWGVESTDDDALKEMNKGVNDDILTVDQTVRVLQKSMDAGIINQGYYMIGFPNETEESIYRDAEKLKNIPIHHITIGIFTPIPLSQLHEEMIKKGYKLDSDLSRHDRNHLIFKHKYILREKIKEIQQNVHDNFYSSREYLERVDTLCNRDYRYRKSFDDYFKFLGKEVVDERRVSA